MVDYTPLFNILKERSISKSELGVLLGISSRTIAKLAKREPLSPKVLARIGDFLQCAPTELYEVVCDNPLLQRLREEKECNMPGGIYHELQIRMTYNSNHIEGCRLSEDQTRLIFETNTLGVSDGVLVDDILETVHHFRAIDLCIDNAQEKLCESFIKQLHYILKHDTSDSRLDWFAVGDYKRRENVVGGRETSHPEDVKSDMEELLNWYNGLEIVSLEDIVTFHVRFERIHPFQDGNGRVGRLVAFKECLGHNIVPFIIEDRKKPFSERGLREWDHVREYLLDTCRDGQGTIASLMSYFDIQS